MQTGSLIVCAKGGESALGILVLVMLMSLTLVIVGFVILVFYLMACKKCLEKISPRRRQMEPGQVWLCLIPLFGLIWHIIMMFKITDSLRREYRARGLRGDGDFGQTAAIIYIIGLVVGGLSFIGLIIHWVKVAQYTRELQVSKGRKKAKRKKYDDEDEEDDYEEDDHDDGPRRRLRHFD